MPTHDNHSKTVIYSYLQWHTLGFGIITSDMEIRGVGYNLVTNRSMLMKHDPKNIQLLYTHITSTIVFLL